MVEAVADVAYQVRSLFGTWVLSWWQLKVFTQLLLQKFETKLHLTDHAISSSSAPSLGRFCWFEAYH